MALDLKFLTQQVSDVIAVSQDLDTDLLGVEKIIDDWYRAKKNFIDKWFNGELIYEFPEPVSFDIGETQRLANVMTFCDKVEGTWKNTHLSQFIYTVKNDFYSNITSQDYYDEDLNITIKKGSKIIKAFKFFEHDKEVLTTIQNEASMIVQEDKITGKLCLSVHPLDYLSSSETNYNWRSCHALDGDYRAGNLSYMVDSATVVCYLKGDNENNPPNFPFPWNNKKWRMLLFVSNDKSVLFAGRQYPFFSDSALEILRYELGKIIGCSQYGSYRLDSWINDFQTTFKKTANNVSWVISLNDHYICIKDRLIAVNDIIKERKGSMFFNDLTRSSYYTPYYTYNVYDYGFQDDTVVELGGKCNCVVCGTNPLFDSGSMLCESCEFEYGSMENDDIGYCSCCGRKIWLENAPWIKDTDEVYCEACAAELCGVCEYCGMLFLKTSLQYDRENKQIRCFEHHSDWRY